LQTPVDWEEIGKAKGLSKREITEFVEKMNQSRSGK